MLCALLVALGKPRFRGQIFATYLGLYALLRGTIEFFRGDPRGSVLNGAVSTSQLIALAGVVAALSIWLLNRKKAPPEGAAA